MKKTVYIAVAALAFSLGCTEEAKYDAVPDATAEGFSIKADIAATKTVFDGVTKVEWEDGDALGVYIDGGETHGLYRFEKSAGGGTCFPAPNSHLKTGWNIRIIYFIRTMTFR